MGMEPETLKRKLEAGERVAILDIREADDYRDWHIPGSLNLPIYNALKRREFGAVEVRLAEVPRDCEVVTVCQAGGTARVVAELLAARGLSATHLEGGMRGWSGVWSEAVVPLSGLQQGKVLQLRRNGKGCLSYLIGSQGQAAVVDASLDPQAYAAVARREGWTIRFVFETHIHADHLSRGRALANLTGAELLLPGSDRAAFLHRALQDADTITVGSTRLEVMATSGHTGESVSYLVDGAAVLTGDTLFVESVGRPDLERAGILPSARTSFAHMEVRLRESPAQMTAGRPAHLAPRASAACSASRFGPCGVSHHCSKRIFPQCQARFGGCTFSCGCGSAKKSPKANPAVPSPASSMQ
ncbi:MAG: MBL fold metallo-hydrolase [Armatimonadetes bacterium]|nr:MBL fold metallo-hydrolase [Armatimonadota bacterium]